MERNHSRFSIDRLNGFDLVCILLAAFVGSLTAAALLSAAGQL